MHGINLNPFRSIQTDMEEGEKEGQPQKEPSPIKRMSTYIQEINSSPFHLQIDFDLDGTGAVKREGEELSRRAKYRKIDPDLGCPSPPGSSRIGEE